MSSSLKSEKIETDENFDFALIIPCGLGFATHAVGASLPTPASINQDISTRGPLQTVRDLDAAGHWNDVLGRMSSGAAAWIALAPKLAPGTDAAFSEGVTISLADSLPKNPHAVLSTIASGSPLMTANRVCGAPFIEPTLRDLAIYKCDALAAMNADHNPEDAAGRDACLSALRKIP